MTGPALAALIERSVSALNEGDFPSAGNVVDSFNRDALERHVASYVVAMDGVRLPVDEDALTSTHRQAAAKAVEGFEKLARLGHGDSYGNYIDNLIAQQYLAELKGETDG